MTSTDFEQFASSLATMGAQHEIHTDTSLAEAATRPDDCKTVRRMADKLGFPESTASRAETAVSLGRDVWDHESITFVFDVHGRHLAYTSGDLSDQIWSREEVAQV